MFGTEVLCLVHLYKITISFSFALLINWIRQPFNPVQNRLLLFYRQNKQQFLYAIFIQAVGIVSLPIFRGKFQLSANCRQLNQLFIEAAFRQHNSEYFSEYWTKMMSLASRSERAKTDPVGIRILHMWNLCSRTCFRTEKKCTAPPSARRRSVYILPIYSCWSC